MKTKGIKENIMFTTYSENDSPPLTLEVLEGIVNSFPKPLEIPTIIYYKETTFCPVGIFYRLAGINGGDIVFHPSLRSYVENLCHELKIQMYPLEGRSLFPWCCHYKQKQKDRYSEFWSLLAKVNSNEKSQNKRMQWNCQ